MKLLYVTTESAAQAEYLGKTLVERRLAACVNILPGMKSIYRWKDKIEEGQEAVLIIKTKNDLATACTEAVKELHSYENPCVLQLDVESGHGPYLSWIDQSCR